MSRLQSLSIRAQLSLLIVFITVLPLGLIAYTGYSQRLQALENANRVVDHFADQLANDQRALLAGTEQLLSALSYIPEVQHHDAKATSDLLRKLRDKNQHIANILVMDAGGKVWASALPYQHPITVDDRRYFRNALATGNFSSGEYTVGKILKKPALSFGYPIKDSSGKITDVATATFTVDKYDRLLKLPSIPSESSLLISDHKGTILFAYPSRRWIGSLDRQELLARMKNGPDIGRFSAVGITGISRIFAYQKVYLPGEKTPYLYIRAGVSLDSVFSHSNQSLLVNISTMLFMLLIMLAITAYVGKRGILDKITALQQATRKVADGDLSVQVSDHVTGGELGTLGRAFDHMISRLKQTLSERAEVTEKLRESLIRAERFSNALDQVPCYIYMKDDQRRYIYANQMTLDLFGCSRDGLQGKDDDCFFPAETAAELREIDERVLRGEQTGGRSRWSGTTAPAPPTGR